MQEMRSDHGQHQKIIEIALALLLVSILIAATFWVLLPFVGILTYAVILATATAGLFDRMVDLLNGRRRLAAVIFGAVAATITVVPLIFLCSSVASQLGVAGAWLSAASTRGIPNLPEWIAGLPLVGSKAAAAWQELQREGLELLERYQPQLAAAGRWLLNLGTGLLLAVLEIFVGVVLAAIFHASRTWALGFVSAIMVRIVGPKGPELLSAAGKAISGVAVGVIGTALLEGVLAWIGFVTAGVPGAVALAAATFFLAVIQIGPLLVWLPVAIWLGAEGQTGWAIFMAAWGIIVLMGTDNIVKPMLIARSGQLPMLVLFIGVIGGLAAWGFTGMFIGATTLAVLWTVLQAWLGTNKGPVSATS
ncbi:AI-2E family transporter [Sinorhizobium medicae]|uniref:AI-2E family transporter n=2 Tax=Sinorhizobium medicae TaxID=110321 RepID=A0ABX4TED4_9HYPH|nr:AI-2E family transporter [Sinorhizobium medicae]PLT83967.1 AI-2E family transporter [Sinorhizobium medicae]PLT92937.1 AI-2E family transporter [Sinorhizobium medicae]PLU12102.1 AI-2E family transporter [Sinorhizobium medicae]PLU14029.1 AI-2E family transporter [Sinorhizobium medicae]PLU30396.1 AI-2E family transporter [Sinorhizobium medicae]